jgi:acyl-CoA synthetase (AMP-forming)/AMP-acid ligase II/thioesterase domain-containing protein/acyl carrier protein
LAGVFPAGPEAAVAFLGATVACAYAPLNPAYREAELEAYLADIAPKALLLLEGSAPAARAVAQARGLPVLEARPVPGAGAGTLELRPAAPCGAPPEARQQPDDPALLLHTSGTLARPKLVPLTQAQVLASAANVRTSLGLGPGDRCLSFMSMFHLTGLLTAVLASLSAGGSVVVVPEFSRREFAGWLEAFRPTWTTAVPAVYQALAEEAASGPGGAPPHALRFLRSSAAPMPAELMQALEGRFGVPVVEAYGMTETHQIASNPLPPRPRKPGSVGLPAGPEVALLDEAGSVLGPGREGEIAVRGPNVFRGYEGPDGVNEGVFAGGWFRTGDLGWFDGDGYLFIRGRVKDMINRGGQKVAPREVEEALLAHPAVAEAVVFPAPHPTLGQSVMAAAVLRRGAAAGEAALRRHLAARLAPYKVPLRILAVAEIPKGPTGKVSRSGLAERWKDELAASPAAGPAEDPGPGAWTEARATQAALARFPAMLRCAVQPRLDRRGRRHLVAFVVLGEATPPEDLQFFLLRGGFGCILPSAFVALDAMPRDGEGEVDWARLARTPVDLGEDRGPAETAERILARLWREILPGGRPSLDEDFFLAGGDSLKAVDLLMRVEAELGTGVAPEAFFRDPTLGGLAAALEAAADPAASPHVVVQVGRPDRVPLWFVHGDFNGGGHHCRRLASLLGPDLPVHTFQPHGLPGQPPVTTVEAMAEAYLPHLLRLQPSGPYRLAGHCNGAVVAFELARHLEARGETVACLALLSPPDATHLGSAAGQPPPIPSDAEVHRQPLLLRRAILVELYTHALRTYVPEPVKAPLDLLVTGEDAEGRPPDLGWARLGGALRVHPLPGDHLSILSDHLEAAAAALAPRLA